jgi:opacity protein-like surface antigen
MTGIGLAHIKASAGSSSSNMFPASSTVFAWQIGIGADIRTSKHIVLDVGLRYLKPSSYKADNDLIKVSSARVNLLMGVQYHL